MRIGTYKISRARRVDGSMAFTFRVLDESAKTDGPDEIEVRLVTAGRNGGGPYFLGAFERDERFDLVLDNVDEPKAVDPREVEVDTLRAERRAIAEALGYTDPNAVTLEGGNGILAVIARLQRMAEQNAG